MQASVRNMLLVRKSSLRGFAKPAMQSIPLSLENILIGNTLGLPRLPIPPLKDTIDRWLSSVKPLTADSPSDWARACSVAAVFQSGDGLELHKKLVAMDHAAAIFQGGGHAPHSYIETFWDDMYLMGRWALPIHSNPYIALAPRPQGATTTPPSSDPQIASAAQFIHSHLKYLSTIVSGAYEADPGACVYQHALQYATSRVARHGRDLLTHHRSSRHIVVMCNDRMYEIDVLARENGTQISLKALAKALEDVRAKALASPPPDTPVHYLTAMDRETWATTRASLENSGEVNAKSLHSIDSALMVVALDDGIVQPDEAPSMFLTGKAGRNRWFDKHQLVVLPSGDMAMNYEHSYSDGVTWCRGLGEVWHDMYGVTAKRIRQLPTVATHDSVPPPQELQWKLLPAAEQAAASAKTRFAKDYEGLGIQFLDYQEYGKKTIKQWKISPDAVAQLALQTAYTGLHGTPPTVYESSSTHMFIHGRTETIRSLTSESAAVARLLSVPGAATSETKKAAIQLAAAKHVQLGREAATGLGVDRHLAKLKDIATKAAAANGKDPSTMAGHAFFSDPLFSRSNTWMLSTSNLSNPFLSQFGFGPVTTKGYGIGYLVQDSTISMVISNFKGNETDGDAFTAKVVAALHDIKKACSS